MNDFSNSLTAMLLDSAEPASGDGPAAWPSVALWEPRVGPGAGDAPPESGLMEPPAAVWRHLSTYDDALAQGLLLPLERTANSQARVPSPMQLAVLRRLHWYFTVDARERAPTMRLTPDLAPAFHAKVRRIMRHIDAESLELLPAEASVEVRHALLAYKGITAHTRPQIDAYDHDQELARVSYFVHGTPPPEAFRIDGVATEPAYAKYRSCRYFHQDLLRQRIAWPPARGAAHMALSLGGRDMPLALGTQGFSSGWDATTPWAPTSSAASLMQARAWFPPGKGGQLPLPKGWAGWKARLLLALSRMPIVRGRFSKAWVFIDREADADDSAEHLYRWVRRNHPEINAWFLLTRSSPDWARLEKEGFKLVAPGLKRRLLLLNSEEIISTHTDYVFGGMDRRLYGDAMRWRYTFLQHGVIKDDLSHWLGGREFDRFITSSPAEHASIVADDTPYPYTDREVRRTGLPRHDRLLHIASRTPASEVDRLLVMPTWRGGLVDERASGATAAESAAAFAKSDYARQWGAFLRSPQLHALAKRLGLTVTFLPHANAAPYVSAFDLPANVALATTADGAVQQLFARTAVFVTDYTSVAFTMALLRRPVFYYQFDQEAFYGGGHNWRPGYFDYDRDGFGPVALTADALLRCLDDYFAAGWRVKPEYLARMERAMPELDALSCQRAFESIVDGRQAFVPRKAVAEQRP